MYRFQASRLMPCSDMSRARSAMRLVVGDEHPALAGRDRLGRVERVGAGPPDRPGHRGRPDRRSGSGTRGRRPRRPGYPAASSAADERLDRDRPAGEVDGDHGLRPRRDGREDASGRGVERRRDRRRRGPAVAPQVGDDLGARREGPGRHDDLVAGSDTERLEREVEGGGGRVERDGVARTDERGELRLERLGLAAGRQPAGIEDLEDGRLARGR